MHEDLAAWAGRLLVAAPATGAVLIDGTTRQVDSIIEAGWVSAVGLHDDRAVVADSNVTVLYDVSEPSDLLWASAWSEVALSWLGDGGPVVIGARDITYNTLGIGAASGRAVAADWFGTHAFEHVEGLAGPDLVVPDSVMAVAQDDGEPEATVEIANLGAMTLTATASVEDSTTSLSETSVVLEPGESARVAVTGEVGRPLTVALNLETHDPDEEHSSVEVRTVTQSGRVTFLACFALY